MKRILILDCETTGLDPTKDHVIEVACILYDVEHATAIESFASLIEHDGNPCENINRIPPAALAEAPPEAIVWARVGALVEQADAVVAHNAGFDQSFTPAPLPTLRPWVCSKDDLRWPKQTRESPSLVALALEHDLGVATAHRAMADCELLARLLTRAHELGVDLDAMLARGLRPKAEFVALVPFERKDEAKAAGFQWDGARREWRRTMAIEDAAALPFKVRQVAVQS